VATRRAYGTGSIRVKHGAWYGSWRTPDGNRRTKKLGPVKKGRDGLSKREAEDVMRALMLADRQQDRRPDCPTVEVLGVALVAQLDRAGRKPSHLESVRYHLSSHINPAMGDMRADDVETQDVDRLVAKMQRDGKAPHTIRNVIGTLHSVLGVAVQQHLITENPADMARLPVVRPSADIRFLTLTELERVITAAPSADAPQAERDWWPVVRLLVLTAAMTGMRLGELRALRWQDLDMRAMKVRVRYAFVRGQMGAPKSRRSERAIPLASRLLAELDAHHKHTAWNTDGDLVLAHPHTGRPLDRVRLLGYFKGALARAGVREVRLHDLRHTYGTMIAASGVPIRTLQEWMGHQDIRTTLIYADYAPGEHEVEMVDAAFAPKVLPPVPDPSRPVDH